MSSILLPGMTQANYSALVTASVNNEGLVNGIWNSILHEVFATRAGVWTINPEVHVGDGYPDFLVNRNTYGPLRNIYTILFEGKNGTGPAFPTILSQLRGYTRDLPVGKVVYLIGARGQRCAFWRFTKKAAPIDEVERMYVQGGIVRFTMSTVALVYDIVTPNTQTSIQTMLHYIRANPPAFASEVLGNSAEVAAEDIVEDDSVEATED